MEKRGKLEITLAMLENLSQSVFAVAADEMLYIIC